MTRYPRLWWRLLRLCFVHYPGLTAAAFACRLLSLVTVPATGLALRSALDSSTAGVLHAAILGAVGAAAAHTVNVTVEYLGNSVKINLVDRAGLLVLDAEILRDVCGIETMDHLERGDFLDRVDLLRGASWGVLASAWNALDAMVNVVRLAIIFILLSTVSPLLLLLLAFAVIPLWFDTRGRRAVIRTETETAEDMRFQRHLFDLATDAASGKEIRVTGAGPELIRRQAAAFRAAHEARFRAQLVGAAWTAGGWTIFTLGFAGALALVVHDAAGGAGSIGDVVLAIAIATSLRGLVQQAVTRSVLTASSAVLLEPYLWLRDYAARERGHGDDRAAGAAVPRTLRDGIRLEHLTYRYPGSDRAALDDVTAHFPAGSVVAIVGEYGSGKSTLVKVLCKFHRPSSGRILLDGTDLADLDGTSWWARLAVTFQDFGRYHTLLGEAVGLGDLPHLGSRSRILEAVSAADADGLIERLPNGLATPLGREFGGWELSEGQWQKIGLARACMRHEPLLFVLDEPTASLDAPSERAIFEHYVRRARHLAARTGAVTVIVSHRFSTVSGADLILVMQGGRLVETGRHESLLAAGGVYAELYEISSRAYTLD